MRHIQFLILAFVILFASVNAQAIQRTVFAEWSYQSISGLAGFRLYHEDSLACETQNPSAASIQCSLDIPDGETWFTLTAFYDDGAESDHSSQYTYTFSSTSTLNADFTVSSTEGPAPHTVTFDASSSSGSITFYNWLFGDGDTASGSSVNHTFTTPGLYVVTLEILGTSGATDRKTTQVAIVDSADGNIPPTAVLASSAGIGTAPLAVTLDASGSTDSDGQINAYAWDLGDGTTASGAVITHTYTTAGTYNPKVTVTDNGGLSASTSTPVLVQPPTGANSQPIAAISASANRGKVPLKVVFSGSKSADADGSITSYAWNFGDGTTAEGKTVDHTFITPGEYTVSLIVQDDNGAKSEQATFKIEVLSQKDNLSNNAIKLQPIINLLLNEGDSTEN